MAREKGTVQTTNNYELKKAAPFDARMKVESKEALTLTSTWQLSNGEIWLFDGLIVAVATDTEESNNGLYMLLDAANYTSEDAWMKCASNAQIEMLLEKINDIEVSSGADIEVGNFDQLPAIGMTGITYFVTKDQAIYRWSAETNEYISFGGSGSDLDNIQLIHGGDSNG